VTVSSSDNRQPAPGSILAFHRSLNFQNQCACWKEESQYHSLSHLGRHQTMQHSESIGNDAFKHVFPHMCDGSQIRLQYSTQSILHYILV